VVGELERGRIGIARDARLQDPLVLPTALVEAAAVREGG
jgi:hypothetical protein